MVTVPPLGEIRLGVYCGQVVAKLGGPARVREVVKCVLLLCVLRYPTMCWVVQTPQATAARG